MNQDYSPIIVISFPCQRKVCDQLLVDAMQVYWGGSGELLGKLSLANKKRKIKANILVLLVSIVFTYDARNC